MKKTKVVNKIISGLLCFCLLWGIFSTLYTATEHTGNAQIAPSLSEGVYTVSTASQLKWISSVCNGEISSGAENYPDDPTFKGYTISLANSISLGTLILNGDEYNLTSGEEWIPIGTAENPFSGTFEGNEYAVSDVYVAQAQNEHSGFFGVVDGGKINSLTVKGYVRGNGICGGIAGHLKGEINKCAFIGRIDGGEKTGGIAGESYAHEEASKIYLSVSACNINTFGGECAGGIVGYAENTVVDSCSGGVNLFSRSLYTAGILGLSAENVTISRCGSDGTITADGETVYGGGVLGYGVSDAEIINSSFGGILHCGAENASFAGGIAGHFSGVIENSYVNGVVSSNLYFDEALEAALEETIESAESTESTESVEFAESTESIESTESTVSDESAESGETEKEKICISGGIISSSALSGATIKNSYFSGISERIGEGGDDICPDGAAETENCFYSYGISYYLHGTSELFHVVALLDKLGDWVSDAKGDYSSWLSVSGVNDTKPVLKHSSAAGSDGKYIWTFEGTSFSFYTDGKMDDYYENQYGIADTPWAVYRGTIRSVTIKEGVREIGNYAFSGFDNLRTLSLPCGLERIGDNAFEYCGSLRNFTLPESIRDIGEASFRKCSYLTSVTIPHGVKAIRKYTFAHCKRLSNVTIPSSVSFVGYMAFSCCDALVTVSLPQSVREIDGYAFYYCEALSTVSLPELLIRIGECAFGRCDKLENVTIPASTQVETDAFWTTLPRGDVDGDGRYSVFDYLKIKGHFLGVATLTNAQLKQADLDFDGRVTATDYLAVKQKIIGGEKI